MAAADVPDVGWSEITVRVVVAVIAVTLIVGGVNIVDEARRSEGWVDWVFAAFALPVLAFLVCVLTYWATLKSW